jgi:hypothetical protein
VNWINVARDRDRWRALVITVMIPYAVIVVTSLGYSQGLCSTELVWLVGWLALSSPVGFQITVTFLILTYAL